MIKLKCSLLFPYFAELVFLLHSVSSDHYPDNQFNCKACTKLKNTITLQAPICVADDKGKFTEEGIKACNLLKASCPEFNKAGCVWYNFPFPEQKKIPCCRLRYKACIGSAISEKTWMEVFYTLQYPANFSNPPVYDIVEIHRYIKKEDSFGQRNQPDWPNNVLNASGERGLNWKIATNLTEPFPRADANPICANLTDDRCSKDIVQYIDDNNYRHGFDDDQVPLLSQPERDALLDLNATIELRPKCIDILVATNRTRACQILFVRHAIYPVLSDGKTVKQETSFVFMEANVYDSVGGDRVVRYGYWFQEDATQRDTISSHCNISN